MSIPFIFGTWCLTYPAGCKKKVFIKKPMDVNLYRPSNGFIKYVNVTEVLEGPGMEDHAIV